jgi:predicted nucleic-acid-binding Zn-ribbon protein
VEDRIRRFVDQHVRGGVCSVCGGTEWFLANEGKPMSFLSFAATHDPRIDVIGVCCGTCGYMRFHSAEIVGDAD